MRKHFGVLLSSSGQLSLVSSLRPVPSSLSLLLENLQPGGLSLLLVDVLHQHTLILVDVTLGLQVEGMVPEMKDEM